MKLLRASSKDDSFRYRLFWGISNRKKDIVDFLSISVPA